MGGGIKNRLKNNIAYCDMRYLYYICSMEKENKTITASDAYKMAKDSFLARIINDIETSAKRGYFYINIPPSSYDEVSSEDISGKLKSMGYTIEDNRHFGGMMCIRWDKIDNKEDTPPPLEVGGESEPIKYDDVWARNTLKVYSNGKYELTYRDTDKLVNAGYWNKYELKDWGIELYAKNNEGILRLIGNYINAETDIEIISTPNI
jgi:hypothetical protein